MTDCEDVDLNNSIEMLNFDTEFQKQLAEYEDIYEYESVINIQAGRKNLIKWVEGILKEKDKMISTLLIKVQNASSLQGEYKPMDSLSSDKLEETYCLVSYLKSHQTVIPSQSDKMLLQKEVEQMKEKVLLARNQSRALKMKLLSSKEYYRKKSEEVLRGKAQVDRLKARLKFQEDKIQSLHSDKKTENYIRTLERRKIANHNNNSKLNDPMSQETFFVEGTTRTTKIDRN